MQYIPPSLHFIDPARDNLKSYQQKEAATPSDGLTGLVVPSLFLLFYQTIHEIT
jgi:hypothetical protein